MSTANSERHDFEASAGPLLFERRNWSYTFGIGVATLIIAAICVATWWPTNAAFGKNLFWDIVSPTISICAPILFCASLAELFRGGFARIRCYEEGVSHHTLVRRLAYRYEDLAALKCGPVRDENGKIIDKSSWLFELEPHDDPRKKTIKFSDGVGSGDHSLRLLRNAVARAMSIPLARRVLAGGRLSWTPKAAFEGTRLIYDFQSVPERYVSVAEVSDLVFEDDQLSIYVFGRSIPVAVLDTSTRNFYPGLFCLDHLRRSVKAVLLVDVADDGELRCAAPAESWKALGGREFQKP